MTLGTRSAAEQSFLNHCFLTPFWNLFRFVFFRNGHGNGGSESERTRKIKFPRVCQGG